MGVGCWAITPEKMEHRLNGRKHIVQLAKDPLPLHQKSNGPSLRYLLHYSKMGFVPERNEFHTVITSFFYASLAPKEDSYRYECRTAFTLHRYKRSSRISVSFWNENLNKLIQKWLVSNNFTLVSCGNRDELVLEQNSFRYNVKPIRVFIPGASRFALLPEHYKFQ